MPDNASKIDKAIVTNLSALQAKYSAAGAQKIQSAIQKMIASDKKRGLSTCLYLLDDAKSMKQVSASAVTKAGDPKQNKDAIDAIYKAVAPDYLLILGSVDVVPHQDLKNPMYSPSDDPDKLAFGDLPYACESKYSQKPQDFFGPTRVVGRLPDITGAKDSQYLINLLNDAANYKNIDLDAYKDYCGISAEVWEKSTEMSIDKTFGNSNEVKTVPPSKDKWPPPFLGRLAHFINCHGAPHDSHFYGQPASGARDYPIALDASYIDRKIAAGTVIAAECCYGAQLYDPKMNGGQSGISNTYLENGAYGFLGSTTIAYGPSEGNGSADLICQYFLQSVLRGASLGRAALEARQKFIHTASMSEHDNIKTIAQFNLYADPSITPIKAVHKETGSAAKKISIQFVSQMRVERADRRRDLFSRGIALLNSQPLTSLFAGKVDKTMIAALRKKAREYGLTLGTILTSNVEVPKTSKFMPMGLTTNEVFPDRVHVIFQSRETEDKNAERKHRIIETERPEVSKTIALIVKESKGTIISARKIFAK